VINIVNIDFTTGVQEEYTVPNNTGSIAFHAVGGDVTTRASAAGDTWTMTNGEKEAISSRDISNEVMYFEGDTGTSLEIRILEGVLA